MMGHLVAAAAAGARPQGRRGEHLMPRLVAAKILARLTDITAPRCESPTSQQPQTQQTAVTMQVASAVRIPSPEPDVDVDVDQEAPRKRDRSPYDSPRASLLRRQRGTRSSFDEARTAMAHSC